MKKIEAIIRKTKFDDVKEALSAADIEWFSYYDVRGEGCIMPNRKSNIQLLPRGD